MKTSVPVSLIVSLNTLKVTQRSVVPDCNENTKPKCFQNTICGAGLLAILRI